MAREHAKTIRAAETVSPYGPGAIVDILGQSFMAPTADRWPNRREQVRSDRLAAALGVAELFAAPTTAEPENEKALGLTFERFPAWLFCQRCRRMVRWSSATHRPGGRGESGSAPMCPDANGCDGRLVPMRFVAVCTKNSHIADVPWPMWVHGGSESTCSRPVNRLRFEMSPGEGQGLGSLRVRCEECGTARTLADLRKDVFIREGIKCLGSQPWLRRDDAGNEACGQPLDPQQRGATSLHFADVVGAIDIPVVESRQDRILHRIRRDNRFDTIAARGDDEVRRMLVAEMAADLGVSEDLIVRAAEERADDAPVDLRSTKSALLAAEFEAFEAALRGEAPTDDFVTRRSRIDSASTRAGDVLADLISDVVLVDRLRDVRAVLGFRRYRPDAELVEAVRLDYNEKKWLPAVQGYGEGVFIRFDGERVRAWASQPQIAGRAAPVIENQAQSELGGRLHPASAEYLLLHSFSHMFMREMAFESGYTAASIRERVYCESDGDYAVFIYTTTTDVEGTLGGLVRQGESDLVTSAIIRGLEQAAWCPNDPVCIETEPQSIDGMNLAACHACSLASETSCESHNLLLDRALLVGGDSTPGFFEPVIDLILGERSG